MVHKVGLFVPLQLISAHLTDISRHGDLVSYKVRTYKSQAMW